MEHKYIELRKWRSEGLKDEDGIVVGSDLVQEWLIPWWWEHYRRYNSMPVLFVDFGLSPEMKAWCRKNGELISLPIPDVFVAEKEEVSSSLIQAWESACGSHFWVNRSAWFKKPLACLRSPFKRSIWIDLDCEIRGPIKELFDRCEGPAGISIANEYSSADDYNSAVIVYKRGAPSIETWANLALDQNGQFPGDQDILSKIIRDEKIPVDVLPQIYNWTRRVEENEKAVIQHWHGPHGKKVIAFQIRKANFYSSLS